MLVMERRHVNCGVSCPEIPKLRSRESYRRSCCSCTPFRRQHVSARSLGVVRGENRARLSTMLHSAARIFSIVAVCSVQACSDHASSVADAADGVPKDVSQGKNDSAAKAQGDGSTAHDARATQADASETNALDSSVIPMACATLTVCCDRNTVPAQLCPEVVAARNDSFCSLALVSNTGSQVMQPGEPYCPGAGDFSEAGPCVALCEDSAEPPSFGAITDPTCKALNACCSSITVSGGTATCSFVALEDDGPPCTFALATFQGLGFCKAAGS